MSQIIVYTYKKTDGFNGVAVCTPTDESTINTVLLNDCPEGAIIIDDSRLPQDINAKFMNAWELNDSTITVNLSKAKIFYLK